MNRNNLFNLIIIVEIHEKHNVKSFHLRRFMYLTSDICGEPCRQCSLLPAETYGHEDDDYTPATSMKNRNPQMEREMGSAVGRNSIKIQQ